MRRLRSPVRRHQPQGASATILSQKLSHNTDEIIKQWRADYIVHHFVFHGYRLGPAVARRLLSFRAVEVAPVALPPGREDEPPALPKEPSVFLAAEEEVPPLLNADDDEDEPVLLRADD
jgi:hypothetical protein